MVPSRIDVEHVMTLLASDRAGHGEPLLLLHGLGSTREDFSALFPRLAEHFDVVSVDLPGHGDSPVGEWPPTVATLTDAVEADLDARGLQRVHILGNSLGARIGSSSPHASVRGPWLLSPPPAWACPPSGFIRER